MPARKPNLTPAPSVEHDRNLAMKYINQGLLGMATEFGERLIDEHPRRFDGYYILARVAKETSDFGMGLKFAKKALELSPAEEAELYRLTVLHATMSGDNETAEHMLDLFDQRGPKMASLSQNLAAPDELRARYYERNSRFEEAIEALQRGRAKDISSAVADMVEGRCLYGLKQYGEAVDVLNRLCNTSTYPTEERAQRAFSLAK